MNGRTGRKSREVTVHDVARSAGVSLMTVSRVVNGASGVAPETRRRVEAAVASLGFVPSRAARSLRSRRSMWVALVFQRTADVLAVEPGYVVDLQEGVIRRCLESGYHVAVEVLDPDMEAASRQLRGLRQGLAPDGLLLAPPLSSNRSLLQELRSLGMPFVCIAPDTESGPEPQVRIDDQAAARQMTQYLLSLGHRRIGFIQGHPDHVSSAQRLSGYKEALREWQVALQPELVVPGDFTFGGGRSAAALLLDASLPPTAIFASNDEMAAGCLVEAQQRGLAVPHDVSVVGFDDTYVASMLYPPLTTIHQSIHQMGQAASSQLLAVISGVAPPQSQLIAHRLVERQSAGSPQVR